MKRYIRSSKQLSIEDLYADAYQAGIENVADILNKQFGTRLNYKNDFETVHEIAQLLDLAFDENGELV